MDLLAPVRDVALPFDFHKEDGYSWQWDDALGAFYIKVPNGEMLYCERFFSQKVSDRSVEYFQENDTFDWRGVDWATVDDARLSGIRFKNLLWTHDRIKLYGKDIPLPRLTAWYGDPGAAYTYSGITSEPNAWNKGLLYIKQRVEGAAGTRFNSVLLNWYRSGKDHLNWHADDEKELGKNPVVASVSFGATRDFVIRRNDDRAKQVVLPLKHGTLLVMRGEMQHFWQHSVPKRKRAKGSRFNLTFRTILDSKSCAPG